MLVGLKQIVTDAAERDYAVAAFNVFGYEDAISVVRAAEELRSPVILAANIVAVTHTPLPILAAVMRLAAEEVTVPVCVHLDHGKDFNYIMQAIRHGFTSVMYDGSQLPFDENVNRTKEIAHAAHAFGVSVEAEIGSVGYSDPTIKMKHETSDPDEVLAFVEQTGIDAVAVSVGTLHRMESQGANIDFDLLTTIQNKLSTPLVIHGATGVPDDQLQRLVSHRVGKINIGTALRMAFGQSLRQAIQEQPDEFDRIKLFQQPMQVVKETAMNKMKLLGSMGRA